MVERLRVTVPVDNTQMTKQAPAEEQSISALLHRYVNMGMVPANGPPPSYGDFTGLGDYHECYNRVLAAQDDFMRLPAQVRKLADNDPGMFLEMLYGAQPEVLAELEAAGLLTLHKPAAIQDPPPDPSPAG